MEVSVQTEVFPSTAMHTTLSACADVLHTFPQQNQPPSFEITTKYNAGGKYFKFRQDHCAYFSSTPSNFHHGHAHILA